MTSRPSDPRKRTLWTYDPPAAPGGYWYLGPRAAPRWCVVLPVDDGDRLVAWFLNENWWADELTGAWSAA